MASENFHEREAVTARSDAVATTFKQPQHETTSCMSLRHLQDRVRKALAKLRVPVNGKPYIVGRFLKVKWCVEPSDVLRIMRVWHNRSALYGSGISLWLEDVLPAARQRRSRLNSGATESAAVDPAARPHSSQVYLIVWRLEELVQEHLKLFPPVQTEYSTTTKPFCIEPHHLLPFTKREVNLLRTRAKFRKLCLNDLQWRLDGYQKDLDQLPGTL